MEEKDIQKEAEEEQPPTRLTEHSLASPDVAWERHSSESHGPPDVSETQYETQLTDSQDEASIKGDDAREGDPDQTVDIEQFHHVEDGQQKGDRIQSLHTDAQGEMQESGSCPDDGSLNSIEEIGTEKLTTRALTEGDGERMDKTSIKGKTTEGECDTMSHGDEDDLKKDCDILLCLRQEEGQEEKRLQRNAAMEFLASEGEGEPIVSEQIRNQLFVNKESAEAKLHQNNGNLPEAQVETCKADNAANLTDMQNSANQREKSGVMNNDSPVELTAIHCSVNDRLILDVRAEQEKHSCKLEVKDCYRQTSQKSTLVTVNSINNVQGIYKDQEVVSQGLNPPTFEEVQRGFPECNNEQRQDENPTHSVLEERDSEECQTVFLPEEMGDKQNVQNNCSSAGSDNLLLTECMVEQQKTKGNIQEVIFSDETVKLFEDKKREMAETSCRGFILLEDLSESGLVRQEVGMEPTCSEDTGDMQDVGLHLEEFGFKGDNIVSKEKSKSKTEKEILNVSVASLSVSNTESGNNLVGESEAQLKAMSNDTVSKSTTKDMTVVLAEETEKHATMIHTEESSLHSAQEVIDEETIDPWIQRALSQDADGVKRQEKPEPGQQMGQKELEPKPENKSDEPEVEEKHKPKWMPPRQPGTEREEGKFTAAQKKLYGDGPSKAEPQVQAEVPSNIVCGRRTFLAHPAAKSMLPPLKTASQLLRSKRRLPAEAVVPERSEIWLPAEQGGLPARWLQESEPKQLLSLERPSSSSFHNFAFCAGLFSTRLISSTYSRLCLDSVSQLPIRS
ncbi:unnamed protein product [Tetraodon nigroviridis]|uniref:Chromosome 15 SCAF14992, whole genome shotgun sequence n=1 Tax=Tetraodon nigroviridis TaxID=99883 RepID=Q4RVI6_TETNG|nr:unnamed protein product [Tetraodon nigroviridis]